jgi:hypothetical protein
MILIQLNLLVTLLLVLFMFLTKSISIDSKSKYDVVEQKRRSQSGSGSYKRKKRVLEATQHPDGQGMSRKFLQAALTFPFGAFHPPAVPGQHFNPIPLSPATRRNRRAIQPKRHQAIRQHRSLAPRKKTTPPFFKKGSPHPHVFHRACNQKRKVPVQIDVWPGAAL